MPPQVSIVVPAWNEEKYLEKSLDTIRSQTFEDFEAIIVDDCSTDRTQKIIRYFTTIDPRFRCLRTPKNSGTGAALNLGFKEAAGDFQTWVSGDSWILEDFIECLISVLDVSGPRIVLAYADWLLVDDINGGQAKKHSPAEYSKKRLQTNCFIGPTWMWRKSAKDKAGDFCVEVCEDYYMHLLLAEQGDFLHVPKVLGVWRNHNLNQTNKICKPSGWAQTKIVRDLAKRKIAAQVKEAVNGTIRK